MLTGPESSCTSSKNRQARTWSARLTQLRYCDPEPIRAPRPSRKGSSSCPSMHRGRRARFPHAGSPPGCPPAGRAAQQPPSRVSARQGTRPVKRSLVYLPPAGVAVPPDGGRHQPDWRRPGRGQERRDHRGRAVDVAGSQLELPDRGPPVVCDRRTGQMHASSPVRKAGLIAPSGAAGPQRISAALAGGRRTRRIIPMPTQSRLRASALPMRPPAPLIAIRMVPFQGGQSCRPERDGAVDRGRVTPAGLGAMRGLRALRHTRGLGGLIYDTV